MKIPTEIKVSAKLFIEVTEWIWIWLNPNDWLWSDEKATSPNYFLIALFPFFACFLPPWIVDTWSPECCSHAMIALLQPSCSLPLLECNLFHLLLGRGEICRDRHDRRSCKICASCVNFSGKQRNFSHNLHLHTPSVIFHWNCRNFTHSVKF